jgi:hypothetical protein
VRGAGHGTEKTEEVDDAITSVSETVKKGVEPRPLDRRRETRSSCFPKLRLGKHLTPPHTPALERAPVDAELLSERREALTGQSDRERRHENNDREGINSPSKKPHRGRRFSTAALRAAEAVALAMLRSQVHGSARFARIVRCVESSPAGATMRSRFLGEIRINLIQDDEELRIVENGRRQFGPPC